MEDGGEWKRSGPRMGLSAHVRSPGASDVMSLRIPQASRANLRQYEIVLAPVIYPEPPACLNERGEGMNATASDAASGSNLHQAWQ